MYFLPAPLSDEETATATATTAAAAAANAATIRRNATRTNRRSRRRQKRYAITPRTVEVMVAVGAKMVRGHHDPENHVLTLMAIVSRLFVLRTFLVRAHKRKHQVVALT